MRSRRRLLRTVLLLAAPNLLLVTIAITMANRPASPDADAAPDWMLLAGSWLAAIAIALGWTLLFARRWVLPIEQISGALLDQPISGPMPRITPSGASIPRRLGHRLNRTLQETERLIVALRARGATLQTIVDALPDPMVLTDIDQKVAVLNGPAARLLKIESAKARGQPIVNVINDEALMSLLEKLSSQYSLQSAQVRLRRDGQRVVFNAIAVRAPTGEVLLELQDVTTLATAMQMKTDFVANASHELRTPLAAIKTAFETMRDVQADDPNQAERCAVIVEGHIRRLEEMLRDLLDLARVENGETRVEREAIDIAELFGTLDDLFPAANRPRARDLRFLTDATPAEPSLFTDRRLLQLILKNLTENSLKFTPAGGVITVQFRIADRAAIFSVSDTGIGIAPEHQQRIFERFYQVDPARSGVAGRGTGLGLAIVKHAVHSLGGTLELRSDLGKGTTIACRFPLDQAIATQSK